MKIQEISRHYDITTHTLRHYEKLGLLSPEHEDNGYRNFSCGDIQKINIIRDLRSLKLPLPTIKDYLDNRSIESTRELLTREMENLQKELIGLKVRKRFLKERLELLNFSEMKKNFEIEHIFYQDRKIILSQESDTSYENLYMRLNKLHKEFGKELDSSDQNVFGIALDTDEHMDEYKVFYCLSEKTKSSEVTILPAGDYLSIYYKGKSENRSLALKKMKEHIEKHSLFTEGLFWEFYLIGFHETNRTKEYVTKIEVKIN